MKKFLMIILLLFVATGVSANVSSLCPCVETYPVDEPVLLDVSSVSGEYWGDFHSRLFGVTSVMCDYFPSTPWSVPGQTGWFCSECDCTCQMFVSGWVTFHDDWLVDINLNSKLCCGEEVPETISFTAYLGVEYGDIYSGYRLSDEGVWAFYMVYLKEGVVYVSMGNYINDEEESFYNYFTLVPVNIDYIPHSATDYPE